MTKVEDPGEMIPYTKVISGASLGLKRVCDLPHGDNYLRKEKVK